MLIVMSALLLASMGSFLYLATSLFEVDKLAYVYDLNSSRVDILAEQTRASLELLGEKSTSFAREQEILTNDQDRNEAAAELFGREPHLLQVRIFERGGVEPERYRLKRTYLNRSVLEDASVAEVDVKEIGRAHPIPFSLVSAQGLHVQNSSLPPDAGILTLAVRSGNGDIVAVDFRHERLLRLFASSLVQETFLLSDRAEVLAHPVASKVVLRENLSENELVKDAFASGSDRGVTEFVDSGHTMLGAYANVGIGGLTVFAEISKDRALQASHSLIRKSLQFGVVIVLATFVVSIFFSRLITAPLRSLTAATQTIGAGNFDLEIQNNSRDEIGDLGTSFCDMANALGESQAQLVRSEKLAVFGQLGAGITHEVKNPLAGIIGFAQLAQSQIYDPAAIGKCLKTIEKESYRCLDILNRFLKFTRADMGVLVVFDSNEVVREVADTVRHTLNVHEVRLFLELQDGLPPVEGNPGQLQQVILNLALNAQDAMSEGGEVYFRTSAKNGSVIISVADNGPGIPKEIQERIFDPFFTTKAPGSGTGLGLAISSLIVREHKGSLRLASVEGQGATFSICLPSALFTKNSHEHEKVRAKVFG